MAEIAAGALVAEQVVSTGLEVGAAASIARPTLPLKATLDQIASSQAEDSSLALARSHHTVTVLANKAYIFGGQTASGQLCNTDVHAISLPSPSPSPSPSSDPSTQPTAEYAVYPAFPLKEASTGELLVPSPRKNHAACARGKYVVVHGGYDDNDTPIDEGSCLWLFDSETLRWSKIQGATQIGKTLAPRGGHGIFMHEKEDVLVLHGGSSRPSETWLYNFDEVAWTQLPSSPAVGSGSGSGSAAALVGDALYTITADSGVAGSVHTLRLGSSAADRAKPDALAWETVDFPASPLTPGPKPRVGAGLVPVTTGYGRHYLIYLLGGSQGEKQDEPFHSGIWSLQVPSYGFNAAAVKDAIRDKLPGKVESGAYRWAEVELVPSEQLEHEGKVHPGPRGFFGAGACFNGKGVVFWGGLNAKGDREGDGWILRIQ